MRRFPLLLHTNKAVQSTLFNVVIYLNLTFSILPLFEMGNVLIFKIIAIFLVTLSTTALTLWICTVYDWKSFLYRLYRCDITGGREE